MQETRHMDTNFWEYQRGNRLWLLSMLMYGRPIGVAFCSALL